MRILPGAMALKYQKLSSVQLLHQPFVKTYPRPAESQNRRQHVLVWRCTTIEVLPAKLMLMKVSTKYQRVKSAMDLAKHIIALRWEMV